MRFLYKNPIPNPCKQDCPDREAGCSVDCKAWADYTAKRNEYYKTRMNKADSYTHTRAAENRTREIILNTKVPSKNRR